MRAALYLRVSTDAQESEGTSLETQESAARAYAAAHGFTVAPEHVYREVRSGADYERPRLRDMVAAMQKGELAAIIVHASDRLSRDVLQLNGLHYLAQQARCELHSVTEGVFETTPLAILQQGITGFVSAMERERIRERTIRGKRARMAEGKVWATRHDLYGYRIDRENSRRVIYEPEAATVRRIFRLYVDEQLSVRGICRLLTAEGVPTPSGRQAAWNMPTLHAMLRHPAYMGRDVFWRRSMKGRRLPQSEHIHVEGITPPLVDERLWTAAQRRLDANQNGREAHKTRNEKRPALLRGRMWCLRCGARLNVEPMRRKGVVEWSAEQSQWRCSTRNNFASARCGAPPVPGAIEALVWAEVARVLADAASIRKMLDTGQNAADEAELAADIERARAALDTLTARQERWLELYLDGSVDRALLDKRGERLKGEAQAARDKLEALESRQRLHVLRHDERAVLEEALERVGRNLPLLAFDERRALVDLLDLRCHAGDGKFRIDTRLLGAFGGIVSGMWSDAVYDAVIVLARGVYERPARWPRARS